MGEMRGGVAIYGAGASPAGAVRGRPSLVARVIALIDQRLTCRWVLFEVRRTGFVCLERKI